MRPRRVVVFFVVTLLTTTIAGLFHHWAFTYTVGPAVRFWTWENLRGALWYSLPLLGILGAHEAGHIWACRRHRLAFTGPYFVPFFLGVTGTLGAIVRVRARYPSRLALLEVGMAGPVAGFLVILPLLALGTLWSEPSLDFQVFARFGEPRLMHWMMWLVWGDGVTHITWHPLALACWIGLLMTGLNLLPYGQCDGGHVIVSIVGRKWARPISFVTFGYVGACTLISMGPMTWALIAVCMIVMGPGHPGPRREEAMPWQTAAGALALLVGMSYVCFMPWR